MERKKQLILITLGVILYFFANFQRVAVPGAIFDLLQKDLNVSAPYITALGSVFMYIYSICQLIVGIMIDRYGGNKVIAFGSVFFCLGSLIFPIAGTLSLIYLSRTLVGLGASTVYLSLVKEIKQTFSSANFGLMLSVALLIGYMGGIFANAPFVLIVNNFGWRESLFGIGVFMVFVSLSFLAVYGLSQKCKVNTGVKFNLKPFKSVLRNKRNINLYLFAVLNYGMYYVLQSVIGMKFLQDFCLVTVEKSAFVLSSMAALYAIGGSVLAFLSKVFYTRKVVFLRIIGCSTLGIFSLISVLIFLDIRTMAMMSMLLLVLAGSASLSPLLVPLLHETNAKNISGTSVSIMTSLFSVCVGFLGNITGLMMNIFPAEILGNGVYRYSNNSYLLIFGFFVILSVISLINVFKLQDSPKTKRLISFKNADLHIHIGW